MAKQSCLKRLFSFLPHLVVSFLWVGPLSEHGVGASSVADGGEGGAGHPDPEITVGGPAGKNFLGAFGSHFGLIISATEAVSRLRDLSLPLVRAFWGSVICAKCFVFWFLSWSPRAGLLTIMNGARYLWYGKVGPNILNKYTAPWPLLFPLT